MKREADHKTASRERGKPEAGEHPGNWCYRGHCDCRDRGGSQRFSIGSGLCCLDRAGAARSLHRREAEARANLETRRSLFSTHPGGRSLRGIETGAAEAGEVSLAHTASRPTTVQGCCGRACQQDGAYGLGAIGQRRNLSSASDRGGIRRSSSIGGWCAFMNCRGDDDIDAKRSRPSIGKTRDGPREERTRAFVWDPISGLHQGQQPKRLHSKAEYMAAPERFAELSDFSLAPRAPSIHGPSRHFVASQNLVAMEGGLNRSTQHSILTGKDGVYGDATRILSGVHCGSEDRALGSLAAWFQ